MTITYALIQMLEKVAEKTDRGRIITKACVNSSSAMVMPLWVVNMERAAYNSRNSDLSSLHPVASVQTLARTLCWQSTVQIFCICLQPMESTALGMASSWEKPLAPKQSILSGCKFIPQVSSSQTIQMQRSSSWQLRHFAVWVAWSLI